MVGTLPLFHFEFYYAYLSPQQIESFADLLSQLRPHIQDISKAT